MIGHELSHHFDDQGRKFDPKGNFADWWTPQDVTRFTALTDKVVKQYAGYDAACPDTHINGELTLGENMADLAGVNVALDAYHISLNGQDAAGHRRFYRRPALLPGLRPDLADQDPRCGAASADHDRSAHSPGQYRGFVVRNLDAWYKAFDVKPGEKYYLAPADRIKIW